MIDTRTVPADPSADQCEVTCPSPERVASVLNEGHISDTDVQGMAEIFKALADPTRVKVAYMLDRGGELCVCDIAELLGCSTATASHHLRTLKNKNIAKSRKAGKNVYYALQDDHIRTLLHMTLEHQKEKR